MNLELKHLAPYFPYKLNIFHENEIWELTCLRNPYKTKDEIFLNLEGRLCKKGCPTRIKSFPLNYLETKPILRPISEFGDSDNLREFQEFIGLGNWCEAYDNYFDAWFNDACSIKKLILQAPQEIFNYFLANHFDVFDLISAGLAVSVQDVGKFVA